MLGRIILVIVLVAVVLWLVRTALAATRSGQKESRSEKQGEQGDLVACAHCGVNLPKSEARSAGGRHYCSEEHWRLGPRKDG
jgi:uncharacterized protein